MPTPSLVTVFVLAPVAHGVDVFPYAPHSVHMASEHPDVAPVEISLARPARVRLTRPSPETWDRTPVLELHLRLRSTLDGRLRLQDLTVRTGDGRQLQPTADHPPLWDLYLAGRPWEGVLQFDLSALETTEGEAPTAALSTIELVIGGMHQDGAHWTQTVRFEDTDQFVRPQDPDPVASWFTGLQTGVGASSVGPKGADAMTVRAGVLAGRRVGPLELTGGLDLWMRAACLQGQATSCGSGSTMAVGASPWFGAGLRLPISRRFQLTPGVAAGPNLARPDIDIQIPSWHSRAGLGIDLVEPWSKHSRDGTRARFELAVTGETLSTTQHLSAVGGQVLVQGRIPKR